MFVGRMFIGRFITKKTVAAFCCTGLASAYLYEKHFYEKELLNRYNELLESETKLSGVYLQQRQPFGSFGYFSWLLPYHQSLKIVQLDGTIRQVGLGKTGGERFSRETGFVLHEGERYNQLNSYEISIPIECWVDYNRKFGHYPGTIDIGKLNKITLTQKEAQPNETVYKETFGRFARDHNDDPILVSCRSAVMYAIREEELQRIGEQLQRVAE